MNYIDQLADQELGLLNSKIANASQVYNEISLLFKDTNTISTSLQLANQYIQNKDYANAYRCFIHSLNYFVHINEQLMEKYSFLQQSLSESNDQE